MKLVHTEYGFIRVKAASIKVCPGDVDSNLKAIIYAIKKARSENVDILVLPELAVTGYTCGDLFYDMGLQSRANSALSEIAKSMRPDSSLTVIVGTPFENSGRLYNCAVVMGQGNIYGIVPKTYIPNYNEFYERRWFSSPADGQYDKEVLNPIEDPSSESKIPFGTDLLFRFMPSGATFGVEICEDLWVPNPPSSVLAQNGATIIANLSATPETIGKYKYLKDLVCQQSARARCAYIYASAGSGESSTDLVFSGNTIIAEDGTLLAEGDRFSLNGTSCTADVDVDRLFQDRLRFKTFNETGNNIRNCRIIKITENPSTEKDVLMRNIPAKPFVPEDPSHRLETCREIIEMQAWGLAQRLLKINCKKVVIGISGGLDSTLALLVADKAFKILDLAPKGIIGVTMPGFGTTDRTHSNAVNLMKEIGTTILEIPIADAVKLHFKDIGQDPETHDATYENSQARERTQILMDLANKENAIVVGTGDLSELALGWCTYNGDHISMYAVNSSIPKTLVGYLVETFAIEAEKHGKHDVAETLRDIVETPISPELIPAKEDGTIAQKTEDLVGPYELHDFFLYHLIRNRFDPAKIFKLARIAFGEKYNIRTILNWEKVFYRRFFSQQFKRSCLPDGPKVGSVCLSPRGDWRMPSDASAALWLKEIETLTV